MNTPLRAALLLLLTVSFACGDSRMREKPEPTPKPSTDAGGSDDATPDDEGDDGLPDDGGEGGNDDAGDDSGEAEGDDGGDEGEVEGDGDDGEPEPPVPVVKFMVIGDQGEGNDKQYMVGAEMKKRCDLDGCDFAVLLGDNIYNSGVTSVTDPQWQTKFELPYKDLDIPFYAVLGNHDYGGSIPFYGDSGGLGNEWHKGPIEVQYTDHSANWKMPNTHYTMKHEHVCFMMLDTNSIVWDDTRHGNQKYWYAQALASMQPCGWVFTAGHHPYKSNGKHGNAGSYELGMDINVLPYITDIIQGKDMQKFFETHICGTADVVLSGHDHNRQWLEETLCGAELIVSGAGAKVTADEKRGNKAYFENFTTPGFLYVVIEGKRMTGRFYDLNGTFEFERVVEKP